MASVHRRVLRFFSCFSMFLVVEIYQADSITALKMYQVLACPQNKTEWQRASDRLNCTDDDTHPINKYHCLPDNSLTQLLEFCYSETRPRVLRDNCMVLIPSKNILNTYNCDTFDDGCPKMDYFSDESYKYPRCLEIDPTQHCYLAESSCITTTSRADGSYTVTESYNETQSNPPNTENAQTGEMIPIIVTVVVAICTCIVTGISLFYFLWKKRKRQKDTAPMYGEDNPLLDLPLQGELAAKIDNLGIDILLQPLPEDKTLFPGIAKRLNIPREILFWSEDNIKKFVNSMKDGRIHVYSGRGMVIGCAEAGKTTLVKKLKREKHLETQPTKGIEIHTHVFKLDKKESTIIACRDAEREATCLSLTPMTVDQQEGRSTRNSRVVHENVEGPSHDAQKKKTKVMTITSMGANNEFVAEADSSQERVTKDTNSLSDISHESPTETLTVLQDDENLSQKSLPEVDSSKCFAFVSNENFKLLSLLDFAGQSAYYACHHIFFSPRAFYILVVDMSKGLDDVAEKACERQDLIYSHWTYADYVRYWLGSIHTYSSESAPAVVVASHSEHIVKDEKKQELERYFRMLCAHLPKKLMGHLDRKRVFSVEKASDINMEELKRCIAETLKSQSHWGEFVPMAWSKLESIMRKLGETCKIILFKNLWEMVQKIHDLPINNEDELLTALRFFHDTGVVLFRKEIENIIILDVQWLVDAFQCIIMDERHIDKELFSDQDVLNDLGLLSNKLLDALWGDIRFKQHKRSLIAHMKHLGMLAELNQKLWYVPCMNKQKYSDEILANCEVSSTLCFVFEFLPFIVFHRLIVACINKLKWSIWKRKTECIFHTVTVLEHNECENHRILIGISENKTYSKENQYPYSIEIQAFVTKTRTLDRSLCFKIKQSVRHLLLNLTQTLPVDKLHFQVGYRCVIKPFIDNPPSHIILEENMEKSDLDCSECSPVHTVDIKSIVEFWKGMSEEEVKEKGEKNHPPEMEPQEKITTKMLLLPFVQELSPISIPNVYNVNHIAHVTSEKIWLSDRKHVMKIDHSGHSLQSFRIDDIWGSASHTAEKDGNILYIKNDHQVIRATKDGNEQTLLTPEWTILSIYASQLNGDILLGIYILIEKGSQTRLARYSRNGQLLSEIEYYEDKRLYVSPLYLSENINGDICTADIDTCLVKAVDKKGILRFSYDGQPQHSEFFPTGICNDVLGHVIVCNRHDSNPSVHLLDMNGQFLSIILTEKEGAVDPWGLCVDDKGNLYLGQHNCATVRVYKYLQQN